MVLEEAELMDSASYLLCDSRCPSLPFFSGPGSSHLEAGDHLSLPSCHVTVKRTCLSWLWNLGCTCRAELQEGWVAVDDSAPPPGKWGHCSLVLLGHLPVLPLPLFGLCSFFPGC
ncbi:unnamed protein product [Rangifer tarandus platyrhynchus]|uniref:Uncharacterized protein n=1 Tax=Rangifer tarandus platyrhynchus TaxID=3082113 RepID=A0ABN8YVG9_RANTA|nr:unnamed protein product [Rangifer tarandus platyrhynchus]